MPKKKSKKRLTKSRKEKILSGVIGGVADYIDIDPTLLRIVWLIGVAFTGFIPGIIVYILAIFIMPSS